MKGFTRLTEEVGGQEEKIRLGDCAEADLICVLA